MGTSWHFGLIASIARVGPTSGVPHTASEKSPIEPTQVLLSAAPHVHGVQKRLSTNLS
jgi:hypothetical protein